LLKALLSDTEWKFNFQHANQILKTQTKIFARLLQYFFAYSINPLLLVHMETTVVLDRNIQSLHKQKPVYIAALIFGKFVICISSK